MAGMQSVDFKGVILEVCPRCAGVWFDDGELAELIDRSPHLLTELENAALPERESVGLTVTNRTCPHGHTLLETHRYLYDSPVEIESCPMCDGVFIENEELGEIAEYYERDFYERVGGAMKGRARLAGHTVTSVGNQNESEAIAGLAHALTHWHNRKNSD